MKREITCRAQEELGSLLMLVILSSKLSYKLKTWLHQGWFVVLAHSEICWSIPSSSGAHSCIFMVYSDGTESGRKMRSNQNVHESWSYLKSRESQTFACWPHPSLWAIMHMILIWEWFRGMCCGNHSNDLQKDPGNWCLHGHAQEFLGVRSSRSKVQISRRFGIIVAFIQWMNGQSKEQGSEFNYESHTDMPCLKWTLKGATMPYHHI